MTGRKTLITGGVRSGKSRQALRIADAFYGKKIFLGTAEALDDEMAQRIKIHKAERSGDWITVEEPLEISRVFTANSGGDCLVLLDCLNLWVCNLLERTDASGFEEKISEIALAFHNFEGHIVAVTNEVGAGVIPADPLSRLFVDRLGYVNRRIAEECDTVILMACGIPLFLKGSAGEKGS